MIIRIYATESGAAWSTNTLIWRSDRQDEMVSGTYYPAAYDVKCSVEAGKIGTLKFVISPEHPYYNTFRKKKTILTVIQDGTNAGPDGNNCLFRGAVSEINVDIYQQATITATDALGFLEDSLHVPTGKNSQKKTRRQWLEQAIADHNGQMTSEPEKQFTLGTVGSFQGKINEEKEVSDTSYSDNMSFIKSNVMDSCNGYLRVRYNSNFSTKYLDFLETYGTTATQKLQFAINIEEISHEDISDDLYTVLVPVGKNAKTLEGYGNGTTAKVSYRNMSGEWETGNDGVTVRIVGKNIEIPDAIANYGYIYKPVSFSDKDTQEAIFEEAKKYISNTYREDNFTLKVKAIDFHYLDDDTPSIRLGDKVTVIRHSKVINSELIERKVIAMCSAIDYDFSSPENTEYTIGTNLENLTNSAGGGGNSSSGSGGGYGGSFHDCIGYMVGDMAVIDHEITQINGGLLDINTSITNINSEIVRLAGRVTITYTYMQSMYSDLSTVINWTVENEEAIAHAGEMYEQWHEFHGSTVFQTMDQWGGFVGLWYATYGPNGEFLGYVYRNGGGLFIQENDTRFGIFHEGNIGGGMTVHLNEATGLYEVRIKGDWVDIDANRRLTAVVGQIDADHAWLGLYKNRAELLVNTLVDYDSSGNPIFDSSGIVINPDQVTVGLYTHDGAGGIELTAGLMVDKINNETTTKVRGDRIDIRANTEANVLIEQFIDASGHFTTAGLKLNENNLTFGVYKTGTDGNEVLDAGVIVGKINNADGADVYIKGTKIKIGDQNAETVINGKLNATDFTAVNVRNLFQGTDYFHADVAQVDNFGAYDNLFVTRQLYDILLPAHSVLDAVIAFDQDNISYANNTISIPYKTLGDASNWKYLTFNNVTSVTGSWSDNVYTVKAGTVEKLSFAIGTRFRNTQNGYSIEAYRIESGSSTQIGIEKSNTYYQLGSTVVGKNTLVSIMDTSNPPSTIYSAPLYTVDMSVTGSWTNNTFNYWSIGNKDGTKESTTITQRYGYTDSGGTWHGGGWTKNDSGYYITNAEVQNGTTTLTSIPIYGTTPYNYGLKEAQVDGRWIGLTFHYWNTSVGDNFSTNKYTYFNLVYGSRDSSGWQNGRWTTDSSGNPIVYIKAYNGSGAGEQILSESVTVSGTVPYEQGLSKANVSGSWADNVFTYYNSSNSSKKGTITITPQVAGSGASFQISSKATGNVPNNNIWSRNVYLTLDTNARTVKAAVGTSSSDAINYGTISVYDVYEQGFNNGRSGGYIDGWAMAYAKVAFWPDPIVGNTDRAYFYVETPGQGTDTYQNKVIIISTDAVASATGHAYVTVHDPGVTQGATYARLPIGSWYTAGLEAGRAESRAIGYQEGWAMAYAKVSYWPTLADGEDRYYFYVQSPGQGIDTYQNKLIMLSTDAAPSASGHAYVTVHDPGVAQGTTFARLPIGNWYTTGYNGGWGTATRLIVWQDSLKSGDFLASFQLQLPYASSVDTWQTKLITLSIPETPAKNGNAEILVRNYGETNAKTHARVAIGNWYQAGWEAARVSMNQASSASSGWPAQDTSVSGVTNKFKAYKPNTNVGSSAASRAYVLSYEYNPIVDASGKRYIRTYVVYDQSSSDRIAVNDVPITTATLGLSGMSITRVQTGASASGVPTYSAGTLYYLDDNDGKFHSIASGKHWYYSSTPLTGTTTVYR